ncbi:MAG: pimeloyl-ACP methyl ester esterase BioH [Candidatus Malihini olakiniferum]
MTTLYWHTEGRGNLDLVLLHGWGLNSQVWKWLVIKLAPHFRLHCVDLPGYGRSVGYGALPLNVIADILLEHAPKQALWLGWSLGGLIASQVAINAPERVDALITIASSPCFTEQKEWVGIKPTVLHSFQKKLSEDFQRTVEHFLAFQTFGTCSAYQDARLLKRVVLEQPMPSIEVLDGGLNILRQTDLRGAMATLTQPMLRIYGALDRLVPHKVADLLDKSWPDTDSVIMQQASHAPFISHPDAVAEWIRTFANV